MFHVATICRHGDVHMLFHCCHVQQQHAVMVMFVWLEDTQTMRDEWKCVSVDTGDMSVTMDGTAQGLWLCASSYLGAILVRQNCFCFFLCISDPFFICCFTYIFQWLFLLQTCLVVVVERLCCMASAVLDHHQD